MKLELSTLFQFIPPLLIIEGFFSGAEIALLSSDRLILNAKANQGSRGAKLALRFAKNPERLLVSTLLMTSLCVISISSLIALYFESRTPGEGEWMSILITSPIIVIFGELIPKTVYQRYATQLAPIVAPVIQGVYFIFYPVTLALSAYTHVLSRVFRPIQEFLTGKAQTERDELVSLLSYGKRDTDISVSEKRMIRRIFDFRGREAKEAMIPLVKVEAIEENTTIKTALERFKNHRHSRMPVYQGRIDNIVGVLEISDLFNALDTSQGVRNYISSAHYIAETHHLEDLLTIMKTEETEMVVIVDEYGGAIGILTFEDIIEEIVGEIEDEHDDPLAEYKEIGKNKYLIQTRMEVSAINEHLHFEIPEGDYETLSGFLLQQFSKIPEPGAELYFDTPAGSLKFVVRKANERQIQSVMVELSPRAKSE